MPVHALRSMRDDVEAAVLDQRVEPSLGGGVYAYLSTLLRLAEDGDRDPELAVGEGRAAVGFLRTVPRLPPPALAHGGRHDASQPPRAP